MLVYALRIASRNRLSFLDMKVFLGVASWISSYSNRYRAISFLLISASVLWVITFAAYHYELRRIEFTTRPIQMDSMGHFFVWFVVFLGSGRSLGDYFSQTNFTLLVTGSLPIFAIVIILRIFRVYPGFPTSFLKKSCY